MRWWHIAGMMAGLLAAASAQQAATCLILPFENRGGDAALDWMGESFYQGIADDLAASPVTLLSREDRRQALAQAGVPAGATVSHATAMRVADRVDADWLVTGWYAFDGARLQVQAVLVDLHGERLAELTPRHGALTDLETMQAALAGELRLRFDPLAPPDWNPPPALPLPAYENYVRGLMAATPAARVRFLNTAAALAPHSTRVQFALGQAYWKNGDDAQALVWMGRVPATAAAYPQARFVTGLADYRLTRYAAAAGVFQALAARWPLPEVLNDWAVAAARQGGPAARRAALEPLRRAAKLQPGDPEIASNLAWLSGLLTQGRAPAHLPVMKADFSEPGFRQLEAVVAQFDAAKSAALPPSAQATFALAEGHRLQLTGAWEAAATNFRLALTELGDPPADPHHAAAAHAGLGAVLLRLQRNDQAGAEIDRALQLDPANAEALALRKQIHGGSHGDR